MIKVSDYVMRFLVGKGIDHVFLVSGGGIMHLVDSAGRTPGLTYVANHHEQASAIAAESYARVRNGAGACLVTTGPGSTNALSAIAGAYVDSVPVIVISGQVRRDLIADYTRFRQLGPQEINIIDMVRPCTKHATTIMDPAAVPAELEKAWQIAVSGRPGPVWVNVPLDIQGASIEEPGGAVATTPASAPALPALEPQLEALWPMLRAARRPLWIFGNGVNLADARASMERLVVASGFPAIFPIGGIDLLEESNPLNMGRFGPTGQRRANFALQNADLLIAVGASLSLGAVGFNTAGFGPKAKKVKVGIEEAGLHKPNLRLDLAIHADLRPFMAAVEKRLATEPLSISPRWLPACEAWKHRYPTLTPDYFEKPEFVHTYVFADALSKALDGDDVVLTGNSLDIVSINHSFKVKRGQRVMTNINFGAMGWDLPGAIGACFANGGRRTILLTGDGTLQFNVQELLTLKFHRLDLKIFLINNDGYQSIRTTQTNFFGGHFVGADPGSGILNPDYEYLAKAFGLSYQRIDSAADVTGGIAKALATAGPVLCELHVSPDQPRSPRLTSIRKPDGTMETKPLQDMFPFLPPEEVQENMQLFDDEDAGR